MQYDTLNELATLCEVNLLYPNDGASLHDYALRRGLLTQDSRYGDSLESWSDEPIQACVATEDLQKSFLSRFKDRVRMKYMDIVARIKRDHERSKRFRTFDDGIIYPKVQPGEIEDYSVATEWITRLASAVLECTNESIMSSMNGYKEIVEKLHTAINHHSGIITPVSATVADNQLLIKAGRSEEIERKKKEYASRELKDSVNGWEPNQVSECRKKFQDYDDKVLYILQRIVGKLNSVDYESDRDMKWFNKSLMLIQRVLSVVEHAVGELNNDLKAVRLV